jgi:hypothetical protein
LTTIDDVVASGFSWTIRSEVEPTTLDVLPD